MKKSLIKGLILGIIFVFSIILFSNMLNKDLSEELKEMEEPTQPVLYMELSGLLVNPMYGYKIQMDPQYFRESITPISTKRELTVAAETYGTDIRSISYQVISADGSQVVEEGKLNNLSEEDGYIKVDFILENRILMDQEYMLCFAVDYGEEDTAYYYTRIVQRAGLNTSQYLEFVQDFYERCMSKETASSLTQYIEPEDYVTNTSYTRIDIHSSFDQITWGEMAPTLIRRAVPTIKEINGTTCSISQDYEITAQDTEGNTEHYNVHEFYRMRYSNSRVMLLDFEREAQQMFDTDLPVLTSQGINLGVADPEFSYTANRNSDIVAFVQEGELWTYNRSANKAAHVFGFHDSLSEENPDMRKDNLDYNIKIIRVEETGDVDFAVYGYMNSGDHEGYSGVAVYHYSAERNVAEEEVFIPSTMSSDFLKSDMEELIYVSQDNQLYFIMENNLYHVNIPEKTYEIILEDLDSDCIAVASSQSAVAWMNEMDPNGSTVITQMNLETGEQTEISAPQGEYIKVLGYINDDLIYGLAREEDIVTDESGDTTFAMYTVRIQNTAGEIIREYSEDGTWVSGAVLQEGLVELQRVQWQNGAYVPIASENVMNNLQSSEETVNIHLSVNGRKGTQVALDFSKNAQSRKLLVVWSEFVVPKESTVVTVDVPESHQDLYYVYAGGELYGASASVNEAIQMADEAAGVVQNASQQYVWERGNQQDKNQITLEEIPEAVLAGTLDEAGLSQSLGGGYDVLNLTGCSLESVLYQVSEDRAVIALTPTGESVVIVGYDMYNTILYNPATQETYYYGMNDSTNLFNSAGNVFYSYMETFESKTAQ
ncbi:MAG: hypothetical protein ACOX8H_12295 [Ruminococcus sp.]|jgi:hypothetical protein